MYWTDNSEPGMAWGKSMTTHQKTQEITARQVESYLVRHPTFFAKRHTLLEHMKVPHPSGDAISLISRQVSLLREKNHKLQAQLDELIKIARTNDELFQKMHRLTLALFDAVSLEDTLTGLEIQLRESFQADFSRLCIIHAVTRPPIDNTFIDPNHADLKHFEKLFETGKPRCGHPTYSQSAFLFGEHAKEVLSVAMIPMQHADMTSILAIGSCKEDRFHARMGHLFLSQMGEIISSHLDNLIRTQYSWLCEPMQNSN